MVPKRVDELLDGGSLYWVIRGQVMRRQELVAIRPFVDKDGVGRCRLVLRPKVVGRTATVPRAFQGWRYLDSKDAPRDLDRAAPGARNMPGTCGASCASWDCCERPAWQRCSALRPAACMLGCACHKADILESAAMIIENQQQVTDAVLSELTRAKNPRFREIMSAAVRHLHAFAREVKLTEAEFHQACAYIAALGKHTDRDPQRGRADSRVGWDYRRWCPPQ